jgi:translation initiation factor IF-1
MEKNSVPLKEVLTLDARALPRVCVEDDATTSAHASSKMRKIQTQRCQQSRSARF